MSAQSRLGLAGLLSGVLTTVIGVGLIVAGDMTGIFLCLLGLFGALLATRYLRRSVRQLEKQRSSDN